MASRKHLVAVNRTIRAGGLDETGLDAAVVEFARDLARRMDSFPLAEVPLNLVRAYQSALKDLQRAHGGFSASRRRREPDEEPDEVSTPESPVVESEEGALAKLRREKAERKAAREAVREDGTSDLHEAASGADAGD